MKTSRKTLFLASISLFAGVVASASLASLATTGVFAAPPRVGTTPVLRPHVIDASRITFNDRIQIDPKLLDTKQMISGTIRYPKTYGKPTSGAGKNLAVTVYTLVKHDHSKDPVSKPGEIYIKPGDWDEVPVPGIKVHQTINPKIEGDAYVFTFSIRDVPYNQEVNVAVEATNSNNLPTPPSTASISFNNGDASKVTLTTQNPSKDGLVFTPSFNPVVIIH